MKILPSILLITASLPLSSSVVFAHSFKNSCDVDIHGGVEINQQTIKFFKKNRQNETPLYKIVNDNLLVINGNKITLSKDQQEVVHNYSTSIRAIFPKVKNLALDGIDVAVDGVTMAFDGLLGKDNDISPNLVKELEQMRQQILTQFDPKKSIYINEKGIKGSDFFSDSFGDHISSLVEKTVQKSMGSILIAMGKEMMSDHGNSGSFGDRMENFGDNLEKQMKLKTAKLEQRANGLCQSMVKIDALEEQLKNKIPKLANINLLTVSYTSQQKKLK